MKKDLRGVPLSTRNDEAIAHFETALKQLQTYVGDPLATLDAALEADPDFMLAHVFKVLAMATVAEQRFVPDMRAALERAQSLASHANARERGLLTAAQRFVHGQWRDACRALDDVLVEHPRDALALQIAHLFDFYRGDALNLRNRVARVLPFWNERTPGYSHVLGMHAFGLEECNQYALAEATARRALAIEARDGWAVHAATHVFEMTGRIDDGIAWLESRENDWAPDNMFAPHNWWHLALFYLDRGDTARALQLCDDKLLTPQADMILVLLDASALLWRLRLEGADVGDRFEKVADIWQSKLELERGFYAFNDLHAMLAFAASGRRAQAEQLLGQMTETAARAEPDNAAMTRDVGLPVARGMLAFSEDRYADAIAAIEPVRDIANRFGGSHAQRDILTLTLIEAAIRNRDVARARHYLAEREMTKPTAWSARLYRRMEAVPKMTLVA